MTGGDFSQEAYQALREAYANQLTSQEDMEMAGVQVMGQKLTAETLPVDSPWRDKIESWQYPTGKSAYTDGPQKTPEEVLEVMRSAAAERDASEEAAKTEDDRIAEMSDEEFDSYVDDILASLDEDEESEEDDDSDVEMSDEETEELVAEILNEEEDEEEESVEEDEIVDEITDGVADEDEPEEETVDAGYDPEEIAAEIAAIREELESMNFTPEGSDDDE